VPHQLILLRSFRWALREPVPAGLPTPVTALWRALAVWLCSWRVRRWSRPSVVAGS